MSSILSSVQGFLEKNSDLFKIAVILIIVGLAVYYVKCNYYKENLYMEDYQKFDAESRDGKLIAAEEAKQEVKGASHKQDLGYGGYTVDDTMTEINPTDLLPQTDLEGVFKEDTDILMGNFVTPGVTYGIDTVGSSLKKANYSIRSMPQIPVNRDLSPWNLSSYEPDLYRKPIE